MTPPAPRLESRSNGSGDLSEKQARGPVAWMAGHSVAANLAMAACLVGGFFMLSNIKQEVFPDIDLDMVIVTVPYPGASPEEVERGIVLAVEEAVRGLDGVKKVTSEAGEGFGTVTVELLLGADMQKLANDVKNEVDRITTFPVDAEEPQVTIASRKRDVLSVVLFGEADERVLHELGEQIRDRMLQDKDITQVDLFGVRPLEIAVEVPQENLRRYGLSLEQVAARLREASVEVPGGGIKTRSGEVLLRMKERRDYGRQFAQLPVITDDDGTEVLVGDIAVVRDGYAETDYHAVYNGKPAIMIGVYRVGDQTPIEVAAAAKRILAQVRPTLPPGIGLEVLRDMADVYRQRLVLLLRNGGLGLILVLAILGLFLEVRLAFWVMMGIPISFLGSLLLLPATGVSINMISLFAYIISLGIVVDDAIVVGENVYHHHQEGMPFAKAAVKGAREVAMPVVFSILTNMVTFLPLYFMPGMMGKIFKMLPIVVVVVFTISLLESLFILPSHLAHQKDRRRRGVTAWLHARQQAFSRGFARWVRTRYGPFLDLALRHRYVTVSAAVATLAIVLSYAFSGRMGFDMFPRVESDWGRAEVFLPYGTPVAKTEALTRRILQAARDVVDESGHPELAEGMFAEVGKQGSHYLEARVYLADPEVRDPIMSTEQFVQKWRARVGPILGVDYVRFESDFGGPGRGPALEIELSHRNIPLLEDACTKLAAALEGFPRVKDVYSGFQAGKQQLDFRVKPEGKALGLTPQGVARQVRSAYYGAEVVRQQRGRNELKVMVRLPEAERVSEYNLDELILWTPAGTEVPLREVAEASRGRAYTVIRRREGRRGISVTADVTPRNQAGEVIAALQADTLPKLVERHAGLTYSFEGRRAEQSESMASLKTSFVLAMLAIFGLLAIPFRSYVQPLIIMVSIPFGIVGAVIGHLIMGYSLSVVSMLGIVALSGVVVNDSLVLIAFANHQHKVLGRPPVEALHLAAIQRFRPILLTTWTTFGGLTPMILERSLQARFLIPMAISLGFGILFATGITLVLVPSLYLVAEDAKRLPAAIGRLLARPAAKPAPPPLPRRPRARRAGLPRRRPLLSDLAQEHANPGPGERR